MKLFCLVLLVLLQIEKYNINFQFYKLRNSIGFKSITSGNCSTH